MKILSSFTHALVVANLYEFNSNIGLKMSFKNVTQWLGLSILTQHFQDFFVGTIDFHCIFLLWKSMVPNN